MAHCYLSADLATSSSAGDDKPPASIRVGMIGLDTSHVPAFAKIFNDNTSVDPFAGIKIVAAYSGGTDLPASRDRIKDFTQQIHDMGIEIVPTIDRLIEKVDVVLLESVDGRIHFEEAVPVILAGKPIFIDKPIAGSLADAIAIFRLARRYRVPIFSSSALRFDPGVRALADDPSLGKIIGAITWGACAYQDGIPDLFFYGIHGVEILYTLMGPGCQHVVRTHTQDTDIITGTWTDGRVGTYRGIRNHHAEFGAIAFGTDAIRSTEKAWGYEALCAEIARFLTSKRSPVASEVTIEMFAFMEAADQSKRLGGIPVSVADTIRTAEHSAAKRLDILPVNGARPSGFH